MQLFWKVVLPLLLLEHLHVAHCVNARSPAQVSAPQRRYPAAPPKGKSSKFLIYDPSSGRQLEPLQYMPIVVGNKRKPAKPSGNLVELPQLWNPCSCMEFVCMCCLGLRLGDTFNQRVCVIVEYNAVQFGIKLRIDHNKRTIATFGFSARNPPAYCIPILLPLPVFACLRLYDIQVYDGNVQVCLSLVLNVLTNQLFEFNFDCIRFGASGVQFIKPIMQHDSLDMASTEELDSGTGEEVRQDVQLGDDYSGISVEGERKGFGRKGRVSSPISSVRAKLELIDGWAH